MKIKNFSFLILVFSFILQLCLGSHYSWSVFAQELHSHYGFTMVQCQTVYASFHLLFTFTLILGGKLLDKFDPRMIAFTGSLIYSIAYILSGLTNPSFWKILLFIGFFGGIGVGLVYMIPISISQKWFPKIKSIVTGIAVAGFGLGAFFISIISELMLKKNITLKNIFLLYGIIFLFFTSISSLFLKKPESEESKEKEIKKLFNNRSDYSFFYMLYFAMFTGLFTGLMIASNLKPLAITKGLYSLNATLGVSLFAIFNGSGRIIWGMITQKINEYNTIVLSLLFQFSILIAGLFIIHSTTGYLLFSAIVGFNYSATLTIYASTVSTVWGFNKFNRIYPLLFTSNGIAGLTAPVFAGWIFDTFSTYTPAIIFAALLCFCAGFSFLLFTKKGINYNKGDLK